ncbi:MAG: hypothetical protein U0354_03810 [Candidatus Sericytochromatia bacterium]
MKKHLKQKIFSFLSLLSLTSFSAYAEDNITIENFKYYSNIQGNISKNQVNYMYLNEDFLNKSENNLKDIRVFDNYNKEIPYILLDEQIPEDKKENKNLEIIDYFTLNNQDIVITEIKEKNIPSLEKFFIDSSDIDFNKKIKIYGSNDKKKWLFISGANIYDFTSKINLRKTELKLSKESSYKFYKFEIQNLSQNEKITMLKLNYKGIDLKLDEYDNNSFRINGISSETFSKNKEIINYDTIDLKPLSENKDKKTIIRLKNNLSINKINFDISESYYYRDLSIFSGDNDNPIIRDSIYDLGNNENDEKKYINLNSLNSKDLRIEIMNYDNPPLIINKLRTQRIKQNLFFLANNSLDYKVFISNKDIESPNYDIRNYINEYNWFKTKYNKVILSNLLENKDFKEGFSKDDKEKIQKNILMTIVFLIVGILAFWIYKLMKDVYINKA